MGRAPLGCPCLSAPLDNLAPGSTVSSAKLGSNGPAEASARTAAIDFYTSSGFTMTLNSGGSYDSTSITKAAMTGVGACDYPVPRSLGPELRHSKLRLDLHLDPISTHF